MSARLFPVRDGFLPLRLLCISFLFILTFFPSIAFSQTIDLNFKPLLQDFGGTFDRANEQTSALQPNGKIPVGEYFTSIGDASRNRRFNADGSIAAGFNLPNGANNLVYDFSIRSDGKILSAGAFTKLGFGAKRK